MTTDLSFRAERPGGADGASDLFFRAVEAIYDAALDPSQWPLALQAFADCLGDIGAVMVWQREGGGFATIVSPTLETAQRDYDENGWYRRDLPGQRNLELGAWLRKDAVTDLDGVSEEEMNTHPFYTEFSARHGLRWRAAIGIAPDPQTSVWIAVQRGPHKPCFSAQELETVTRLGRHAEKSLRLSIKLLDAELTKVGLSEALARIGVGVFALDLLGRIVFMNPAAEQMVGEQIQVSERRLRFGVEASEINSALARTLRDDTEGNLVSPKPMLVHRKPPDRPLAAYLLPIAARSGPAAKFLTNARALVMLIDPDSKEPADAAIVRDILGVTLGEARVAALVGAGVSPRQAAEKLGVTEETVRTVLKRVFSKVGVSRQSELATLLTKLVLR